MAGIGSFIEGAMDGYTFAENVEDRKQRRARRKEDWDWQDKVRERSVLDWQYQDRMRGRADKEYQRAEQERSVLSAIGNEAVSTYKPGDDAPETRVSTRNGPEQITAEDMHRLNAGASRGVVMPEADRTPTAPEGRFTAPEQARSSAVTGNHPKPGVSSMPSRATTPRQPVAPEPDALTDEPGSPAMREWEKQYERLAISNDLPPAMVRRAAMADAAAAELQQGRNAVTGKPLTEQEMAQRSDHVSNIEAQLSRVAPQAKTSPIAAEIQRTPSSPLMPESEEPATSPVRAAAFAPQSRPRGVVAPEMDSPPAVSTSNPARPPAPANPPRGAAMAAEVPVDMPDQRDQAEINEAHRQAVSLPPDKGGSPSIAVAFQGLGKKRAVLGRDGPVKSTKGAAEKASANFLDHYAKTAVPKIVKYYASQGDIEKAEAFETWANSREAKGQLKSWSKAIYAASIGDEDAFIGHIAETYNSFDDGYEMVRDQSEFDRDSQGNIAGAKIALRNTRTGEVHFQKFEDQADIIRHGIYTLSPEQVFEYMWGEISAASKVSADQLKFERELMLEQVKQSGKGPANAEKSIALAKKALQESMLPGEWAKLGQEEQNRLAIQYVRANREAGQALGQPQAPPPYQQ